MDPTLAPQVPGQQAQQGMGMPPGGGLQQAAQNALLLQAIKAGGMNGAQPQQNMAQATGPTPLAGGPMGGGGMSPPPPTPPVDPGSMTGGMGSPTMAPQMPMQGMGQMAGGQTGMPPLLNGMAGAPTGQGTDPITAALFSQIPGGQ